VLFSLHQHGLSNLGLLLKGNTMSAFVPTLDTLRKPLFVVSAVLMLLALLVESASGPIAAWIVDTFDDGYGVPYTALLDALLLFAIILVAVSLLIPERIQGRIQGIATLIVSFFIGIGSFVATLVAFIALMVMVTLLLSVPFGTIAYVAIFGHFDRGGASAVLTVAMILKLLFAAFLILAHQRFLQNKGLVLLIAFSLLCTFLVQFLHALVPRVLVSITDAIAGIIVGIVTLIWAIWFFLRSLPAIVKAVV
jgi:hypothetical protein